MERVILHVDMDEFFAAVEKLDNPALRGKALLIGAPPEARGVVSTASYEARAYGCHSAMPMSQALRLCPQAVLIYPRHERYQQASDQVFAILQQFTPLVEPLSIDEAFLDVTGCEQLLGTPEEIARTIKRRIAQEAGLTASVGVAPNKFLAKLASDLRKPDGLVILTPETIQSTLDPLPVGKLWGAGPATVKKFQQMGVRTIGQVRRLTRETLVQTMGKTGEHFYELSRGIDERPVVVDSEPKSIGQEETFPADVDDLDRLRAVLLGQVETVSRKLREQNYLAKTVTLKIRYGDFRTLSRSATLPAATDVTEDLWRTAESIFSAWAVSQRGSLRLLGVAVSHFSCGAGRQLELFGKTPNLRQQRLDEAMDRINERFGKRTVQRARSESEPPRSAPGAPPPRGQET